MARIADRYSVVRTGLDNPRQLQILKTGNVLVAEAGHGANSPAGCSDQGCRGRTGEVTLLTGRDNARAARCSTGCCPCRRGRLLRRRR
jgi:hypothetical protein